MRNGSFSTLTTANNNVFIFGRQSRSVELITLTVSVLTIAVGLVGNLLLSLTIATSASLRTPMNTFVLSIGLVDLLTSVFLLPLRVFVERKLVSNQEIDPTIYGVELFVRTFTDITRLFLMMSLSLERYQSIANPLSVSKDQAKRRAVIMSGMTWTVSIALSGISIRYFCDTVLHQPCLDSANGTTTNWGNLEVFVEMPLTILSILAIAICYSLIVMILRQQRKKMTGHLKPKTNQVVPVDSSKISQLQLKNGSKVEISENKVKTNIIEVTGAQDDKQQMSIKIAVNNECNDSNCVVKTVSYLDNIKIDNTVVNNNHDPKIHSDIKEFNHVKPGVIEEINIDASHKVCNNFINMEINSHTSNQTESDKNIENSNSASHGSNNKKEREVSPSSRSPIITSSSELVTGSNKCLSEDSNFSLECHVANVTNIETPYTNTHSMSPGGNYHPQLSLPGSEQSANGGTHSLDSVVKESIVQLTDNVSSTPLMDKSDQTYTQGLKIAQSYLVNDNGDIHALTHGQPSLSIRPSDGYHDIQSSISRGKQRHSIRSTANANHSKTLPLSRNPHAQRLQSVIAYLHANESTHAKNKISNNSTLHNSSDTSTDHKVILASEGHHLNPSQVPSDNKQTNLNTDQHINLTNDNPTTPSSNELNSHSQSSLSDFAQETSSKNTTLQTSLDSELDNDHEGLSHIYDKQCASVSLSYERNCDCLCSDIFPENNNPSVSEIQSSEEQQKSAQLATNCINSPTHQVAENIETKDSVSMPAISVVDTTAQSFPNSLEANSQKSSDDQKTIPTDAMNDKGQHKRSHLHASDGDRHVEIVEMDGTVHLQLVKAQSAAPIEGAVCLMNPRNKEQGKRRVELKAALKVGLIVCCFACLWMPLPLSVCILRGTSCWMDSMKVDMLAVFSSLATSTAAIDPILYGLLNPQIRSALQVNIYKIRRKIMNYCTK